MSRLSDVVEKYQNIIKNEFQGSPETFDLAYIGKQGIGNRKFYTILFSNKTLSLNFLFDAGLIKRELICPHCGDSMVLKQTANTTDKVRWECNKHGKNRICRTRRSIRVQSWFSSSKLSLGEIMNLTYEILNGTESKQIIREFSFSECTICEWRHFITEQLVGYIEKISEQIGGPNVIVEVDECQLGDRNKKRRAEGQFLFGGLERESGKCFLVAIEDNEEFNLIETIEKWIKPESTVITDSWASYKDLSKSGLNRLKGNHSISFVNELTGPQRKPCKSIGTWHHVKTKLGHYTRGYLARYMFEKQCENKEVDQFNAFLELVREITF